MATRPNRTVEHRAAEPGRPALRIERSTRRRKSASAYPRDGTVVVQLPARLPAAEEERLIAELVAKVTRRQEHGPTDDGELRRRAEKLADRYLDGVRPSTIRWSSRMRRRYGSCTPADGSVRISRELAGMPDYVRDYVIVHELAHLLVPDHSARFHALVGRFPDTERAKAFLDGYAAGQGRAALDPADTDDVEALDQADRREP